MNQKFLHNHPNVENKLIEQGRLSSNHVIVDKFDYEKTMSSIKYGRVKVVNGELLSNSNFIFEPKSAVYITNKEILDKWEITDQEVQFVMGRANWVNHENDYFVVNEDGEYLKQVPESDLTKQKPNKKT